jgi:hypothetical protein
MRRSAVLAYVLLIAVVSFFAVGKWKEQAQQGGSATTKPSHVVEDGVDHFNCEDTAWRMQTAYDFRPEGDGPLRLSAIYCQSMEGLNYRYPHGDVIVSPDARRIVYASDEHGNGQRALHVARLEDASAWIDYNADLGISLRFLFYDRGRAAFEWSADSRFVWAAKMEHMRPLGGWAIGPMRLLRAEDGVAREFSVPRHEAGPLDGVQWVGHEGKALALFGARGSYHKPERVDRAPTIAMIDAKRAVVLDAHAVARLPNSLSIVESVILADGRMRALLIDYQKATLWTQGEPLVALPVDTRDAVAAALTPDGEQLLVQFGLPVRAHCDKICEPTCNPPAKCWRDPPNEGVLAALYALPDGRVLWTLRARREEPFHDRDPVPAISPDGAYALIGLPFELYSANDPARLALVSMRDGKIVQTMRAAGPRSALGFAKGGAIAWTHNMGLTLFYSVAGAR